MDGDASCHLPLQHADHICDDDIRASLQEKEIRMVHHIARMDHHRFCQRSDPALENDTFHTVRSAEFCRRPHDHDHILQHVADRSRSYRHCSRSHGHSHDLHQEREVEEHPLRQEHRSDTPHGRGHMRSNGRPYQGQCDRHLLRKPQLRLQRLRHAVLFHHDFRQCRNSKAEGIL